ncbi:non-functional pseudokinase ZED1 [Ricinus communis]|uniref:non-functional pseudokinase ZED1 n=1 Tax=Ricinus communis TaxID=3988 RepID=UPI00201B1F96|nr:non-functional pseudokinase ZED1 [Ricinus communis]
MFSCWKTENHKKAESERISLMNGRMLLEKLIASCDGRCNPIRIFSADELSRATDDYDPRKIITQDSGYKLYNGLLHERTISVKKFKDKSEQYKYCYNDIMFATQMSKHKNFLKLLGCCLETQIPVLVFEPIEYGTLAGRLYGPNKTLYQPLLWRHRLKIAVEIANAVSYLHTAFSRPIVFRNIKPLNIFLDECHVAKLSDFSLAVSIPEGESHVKDMLAGAWGLIAPEYAKTSCFNESQDVYNFGVFLLMLLTGQKVVDSYRPQAGEELGLVDHVKKFIADDRFYETVDSIILGEGSLPEKDQQLQAFTLLSFRCISEADEDRPMMIDVAKELRKMYKCCP